VKDVLQIIPQEVFVILQDLIISLSSKIEEIPLKINKNDLKKYTFYQERAEVA